MVKMTGFGMYLLLFDFHNRSGRRIGDGSLLFHLWKLWLLRCGRFCFSAEPEGSHRIEPDEYFINQDGTEDAHHKSNSNAQREVVRHIHYLLCPECLNRHVEQEDDQGN